MCTRMFRAVLFLTAKQLETHQMVEMRSSQISGYIEKVGEGGAEGFPNGLDGKSERK